MMKSKNSWQIRCSKILEKLMPYSLIQRREVGMTKVQILRIWIMILEVVSMEIPMRSSRCSSMVGVDLVRVVVDLVALVDHLLHTDSEQ
jgi:hypothetical protein